jgi:hypothetical protein
LKILAEPLIRFPTVSRNFQISAAREQGTSKIELDGFGTLLTSP